MISKHLLLHCFQDEHPRTHNVFGAMIDGNMDYRPHPTSRSAKELAGHMIGHYNDLIEMLRDGVIHHRMEVPVSSVDDVVEQADASAKALVELLGEADEADLDRPVKMWVGEHLAWEAPANQIAMGFLFDMIHHRGQLSTYLRPMGGKVPAIYGPSADDSGQGEA